MHPGKGDSPILLHLHHDKPTAQNSCESFSSFHDVPMNDGLTSYMVRPFLVFPDDVISSPPAFSASCGLFRVKQRYHQSPGTDSQSWYDLKSYTEFLMGQYQKEWADQLYVGI